MPARFSNYRHTKIIITLGPATESPEIIRKFIEQGVDAVRLNMAHASREWVVEMMTRIRKISAEVDRHVAIMMDVKGPEIRTGDVENPIDLAVGDRIRLVTDQVRQANQQAMARELGRPVVPVNYLGLPSAVEVDSTLVVDSGLMRWTVIATSSDHIDCEVATPGTLSSRRHINLPGVVCHVQ